MDLPGLCGDDEMNKILDADKVKKAFEIIERAKQAGCHPSLEGDWLVWKPCLPIDILMEAVDLNTEIAAILNSNPS